MESGVMEFSHVTNDIDFVTKNGFLFVKSVFRFSFFVQSIIFQSFGDVIIAGEGLQILTYDRH